MARYDRHRIGQYFGLVTFSYRDRPNASDSWGWHQCWSAARLVMALYDQTQTGCGEQLTCDVRLDNSSALHSIDTCSKANTMHNGQVESIPSRVVFEGR